MSGTFQGVGTLQFTPDNKHVFASSGLMEIDNTETTMLEFQTNSEYLKCKVQFNYPESDGDDFLYQSYFDNVVVQGYQIDHSKLYGYQNSIVLLIIPPFTTVKLTAINKGSSTSRTQICSLTGEVGMPQRVGNLDD